MDSVKMARFEARSILLSLLLPLVTIWGCQGSESEKGDGVPAGGSGTGTGSQDGLETWTLSDAPLLEIGVREGEEPYQLHRARGSVLLDDGRVVVSNGGSQELRFFDSEGRFLKAVGGDGEGPGEFRFPTRIRRIGRDSLLTWDQRLNRVSYFDVQGEYLGSETVIPTREVMFPGDEWLLGRFWIDSPLRPSAREPIRQAVANIPIPDSLRTLLYLKVTRQGRLWASEVRPPADTAISWTVHDLEGAPVAAVTTPARFEPHDIGPDYVLGRFQDEVDVNYIRLYALRKPEGTLPGPGLDSSPPAVLPRPRPTITPEAEQDLATLKMVVKNLASLEEIHYADNYTYTTDVEELFSGGRWRLPDDVDVSLLFAGREGWMGTVTSTETGRFCALVYGYFVPMGWRPGEVICP